MPSRRDVSDAAIVSALRQTGCNIKRAAKIVGMSHSGCHQRVATRNLIELANSDFDVTKPPSEYPPIEEILEIKKKRFKYKQNYEEGRRLIDVRIRIPGPIGIIHLGDPHVDDDGTDIESLEQHIAVAEKTEGMYLANVGDTTNNWIGRLARLYGEQSMTTHEAWMLAEWFLKLIRPHLLYCLGGNHDAWSGAGDPIKWILANAVSVYESSEIRLDLAFPNKTSVRINARHDFVGHSQWNPAHGVAKSLQIGSRDHIAICGHKHVSGYMPIRDPNTGMVMHAIQVASYKIYDRYKRERGFRDNSLSPCAVTVIDPELGDDNADKIKVFWEPEQAADYLTFLRRR